MSLTSLQLFKNLSDETRLGIVLILKEMGELCVCDLCTALDAAQDLPPSGNASGKRTVVGSQAG